MKNTLCIILFNLLSVFIYSQNLIHNSSFEQNLNPYCAGWFTGCNKELSCDSLGECSTRIFNDSPGDTLVDKWSLLVYGNTWPFENHVDYFVTSRSGTFVYQMKFWMNTMHFIGYGRLGILDHGVFEQKDSITDILQPWTEYILEDTLTTAATDTIVVRLTAGAGDFCICDVYFDQVELNVLDSIPTGVQPVMHNDDIEVFPNPVVDVLSISTKKNSPSTITIFNSQGQLVVQQESYSNMTTIDLNSLPTGIYYYKIFGVKNAGKVKVGKLVKT